MHKLFKQKAYAEFLINWTQTMREGIARIAFQ
jgi:hypothetical protein